MEATDRTGGISTNTPSVVSCLWFIAFQNTTDNRQQTAAPCLANGEGHFSAVREEQPDDLHMVGLWKEIDERNPLKGVTALCEETEVP